MARQSTVETAQPRPQLLSDSNLAAVFAAAEPSATVSADAVRFHIEPAPPEPSASTTATRRRPGGGDGQSDDLKLIYGVGPILERMLNHLGIYWFRDVARWTEEDIDRIDAQLEHFHGRIRRENWISSAKEEHFKKYGEHL